MLNKLELIQLKRHQNNYKNILKTKSEIEEMLPSDIGPEMQSEIDRLNNEYETELKNIKSKINTILKNAEPLEKAFYEVTLFTPHITDIMSNNTLMSDDNFLESLNTLLLKSNWLMENAKISKIDFFHDAEFEMEAVYEDNQLYISEMSFIMYDKIRNIKSQIELDVINDVVRYFDKDSKIDDIEFIKEASLTDIVDYFKSITSKQENAETIEEQIK